jgi:hypothetical protein
MVSMSAVASAVRNPNLITKTRASATARVDSYSHRLVAFYMGTYVHMVQPGTIHFKTFCFTGFGFQENPVLRSFIDIQIIDSQNVDIQIEDIKMWT